MSPPQRFDIAAVLDVLPAAVVLAGPDGRITGWNRAAEVLYGHLRHDVVGQPLLDVLFELDDRDAAAALLAQAATGLPWSGDTRVRRRDGALLVSSFLAVPAAAGGRGSVAWVATDGMDQGLAEQERSVLLSAEHAARATAEEALGMLEAVLGSAPVAIAVFDLDLRYLRVNDAYAQLSGRTPDEHVGGGFGDVVPIHEEVATDLRQVADSGQAIIGRVIEVLAPGDDPARPRYFSVSYFPVRLPGGSLIGAALSGVEITQLKRVEAERLVLLRRAEAATQRLSILATASSVLSSTLHTDELLRRLAAVLAPAVADWCAVALFGGPEGVGHAGVWYRGQDLPHPDLASWSGAGELGRAGWTGWGRVRTGGTMGRLLGVEQPVGALGAPLGSSLAVPIEANGEVHGALILATDLGRPLGDDDLELAADVAHRAALAVGNARAFEQERAIAETLQRALLPASVPAVDGLDLAVRYLAATEGSSVGGDWYDVLILDEAATGLVIGDVVGHDIAASTSMGQLRSALRVLAHEHYRDPAGTLARLDRIMGSLGLSYATCIFAVLDRPSSTLTWTNAGHPPPVLVRAGAAQLLAGGSGILLGVTAGADAHQDRVTVQPGDVLVFYTDGLIERRGGSLEVGLQRLGATAAALHGRRAEDVCQGIVEEMLPTSAREDDVAILVVVVGEQEGHRQARRMAFEPVPESVARARRFTAEVLAEGGHRAHLDVAVLLVSELVTNAVRHAGSPGALVVTLGDDRVEIAVEDADPDLPALRRPSLLDEGGRGLALVDALAAAWGSRPTAGGKAIWFWLPAE